MNDKNTKNKENSEIIYVSELSDYFFCPRSWYIKKFGGPEVREEIEKKEEVKRGAEKHEKTINQTVVSEKLNTASNWLFILAFLLAVMLCLFYFFL